MLKFLMVDIGPTLKELANYHNIILRCIKYNTIAIYNPLPVPR